MPSPYSLTEFKPKRIHEPSHHYHASSIKVLIDLALESAIEVQRFLPLVVSPATFREALAHELFMRGLPFLKQVMLPISYRHHTIRSAEFMDIVIDQSLGIVLSNTPSDQQQQMNKLNYFLNYSKLKGMVMFNIYQPLFKKNILYQIR